MGEDSGLLCLKLFWTLEFPFCGWIFTHTNLLLARCSLVWLKHGAVYRSFQMSLLTLSLHFLCHLFNKAQTKRPDFSWFTRFLLIISQWFLSCHLSHLQVSWTQVWSSFLCINHVWSGCGCFSTYFFLLFPPQVFVRTNGRFALRITNTLRSIIEARLISPVCFSSSAHIHGLTHRGLCYLKEVNVRSIRKRTEIN